MKQMIDFSTITACGECCTSCPKKIEGKCKGCLEADGYVPEWAESGRCRIHACVKEHEARFCGACAEFPCEKVTTWVHWRSDIIEHLRDLAQQYRSRNQ